ncbi:MULTISPECIES: DUF3857 domain-containing protein [unclassified Empedobacter]|uniref:DUF3857 domain-containing protein n=1 Tax=unclassified Empedobacter TaxID=2643773 RepID=UPI0025BDD415|nr:MULTISPECIES: DUF3857 domain-containing protein [unclassified Empedobacter]
MKFKIYFLFTFLLTQFVFAQSNKFEFGKISEEEYNYTSVPFEVDASAVTLSEYGNLQMKNYGYVLKQHIRKKILKQDAVDGNVLEFTYNPKNKYSRVKINNVQVYNKINNEIIISKLNKKDIIEESIDENTTRIIYAIPNVKVGSIIEYETEEVRTADLYATPWNFQNDYPILKSKLDISMHTDFDYRIYLIGQKLNEKYGNRKANKSWEIENVPSVKKFDKIYNIRDFKETIGFQYTAEKDWHGTIFSSPNWTSFRSVFAKKIETNIRNVDFNEIAIKINNGASQLETYKNVIEYVKLNYKANENNKIDDISNFKSGILRIKSGTNLELVILVNKLLKSKGIESHLVINSFRSRGRLIMNFPIVSRISRIQTMTVLDNQIYLFDDNILKIIDDSYKEKIVFPYLEYYNQLVLKLDSRQDEFLTINPPLSESYLINEIEFKQNDIKMKSLNKFKGYFNKDNQKKYDFPMFNELVYSSENINNVDEYSSINKIFAVKEKVIDYFGFEFPFNEDLNYLTIEKNRKYQVELDFPFQKVIQFKSKIPTDFILKYDNFDKEIKALDNKLHYKQQIEVKNNEFVITYILLINQSIISSKELKEYSEFLSKIAEMNKDIVVLKKKN